MKTWLLLALIGLSGTYLAAQSHDSTFTVVYPQLLATHKTPLSGLIISPLSGILITKSQFRYGGHFHLYRPLDWPFPTQVNNYDLSIFAGTSKSLVDLKLVKVYCAVDLGIGKSRNEYERRDVVLKQFMEIYHYLSAGVSGGLQFDLGNRLHAMVETQLLFKVGQSETAKYDPTSRLPEADSNISYLSYQHWLPIRSVGFGWRI